MIRPPLAFLQRVKARPGVVRGTALLAHADLRPPAAAPRREGGPDVAGHGDRRNDGFDDLDGRDGASGSGNSTAAAGLVERLGWEFGEGDEFHPPENVEKMRAGHPLDDEDRRPWLRRIAVIAGVGVIAASGRFVRAGEASRTEFWRRSPESGFPRIRRAYGRTMVIVVGSVFVITGFLNLIRLLDVGA